MASAPAHDWFLRQWLDTLNTTQAELERLTGWDKRKASFLVNGKQPYKRETVNEAASALHVRPYELLMHPDEAMAIRRFQKAAEDVVEIGRIEGNVVADVADLPAAIPAQPKRAAQ